MNAARLNELLGNPGALSGEDLAALENLCRDFPAFSLPYFLLARAYHDRNDYRYRETLHAAALRCPNRLWLHDFMEGRLQPTLAIERVQTKSQHAPDIVMPSGDEAVESDSTVENEVVITETETTPLEDQPIVTHKEIRTEPETSPANPLQFSEEVESQPKQLELERADKSESLPEDNLNSLRNESSAIPQTVEEVKPWKQRFLDQAAMTVYSIEDHFPPAEPTTEHTGARDFFTWLRNPHKIASEPTPKPDPKEEKDDIIQRFLETRPSVSRPKKEFFNPINMAKKSEQENPELVTCIL